MIFEFLWIKLFHYLVHRTKPMYLHVYFNSKNLTNDQVFVLNGIEDLFAYA